MGVGRSRDRATSASAGNWVARKLAMATWGHFYCSFNFFTCSKFPMTKFRRQEKIFIQYRDYFMLYKQRLIVLMSHLAQTSILQLGYCSPGEVVTKSSPQECSTVLKPSEFHASVSHGLTLYHVLSSFQFINHSFIIIKIQKIFLSNYVPWHLNRNADQEKTA